MNFLRKRKLKIGEWNRTSNVTITKEAGQKFRDTGHEGNQRSQREKPRTAKTSEKFEEHRNAVTETHLHFKCLVKLYPQVTLRFLSFPAYTHL
jgi:uncharacterized FlaG/YvyC family protein